MRITEGTRTVLLLGEGNFSYALARVRLHLLKHDWDDYAIHMIATSYDSEEELYQKYPESRKVLTKLRQLDNKRSANCQISIYHRVDATNIRGTLPEQALKDLINVDEITFCHPHIGSEDLRLNSSLVAHFFNSAKSLRPKVIQVSLLKS